MSQKAFEVLASGRVQGVFYRKFVKENALELGVKGFVQNLEDGRVKAVCVCKKLVLEKLVEKMHTGPMLAKVENIQTKEISLKEKFEGFEIRH